MGTLGTVFVYVGIALLAYLIGSVNFAKIIAWHGRRKDITKIGSKNPGTMNMLRSFGLWLAVLTFVCEVAKAGLTCLLVKILTNHFDIAFGGTFAYYLAGLFVVLGYDFPVWSKFKGGKGVACFCGILLFSPLWYVALGWLVICFIILIIIDIGSVVSFLYTGGLVIANILYVWLAMPVSLITQIFVTSVLGFLYILTLIKHRANIKRLINGTENKVGFKAKLQKVGRKKEEIAVEIENINQSIETEKVVEETKNSNIEEMKK